MKKYVILAAIIAVIVIGIFLLRVMILPWAAGDNIVQVNAQEMVEYRMRLPWTATLISWAVMFIAGFVTAKLMGRNSSKS